MPRVVNQIILGSPLLDVASPGWLLSAAVPILLGILHHQPVKSLVKSSKSKFWVNSRFIKLVISEGRTDKVICLKNI